MRGACEARLERMEVSPPTHTSFGIAENNKRTLTGKYMYMFLEPDGDKSKWNI